MRLRIIPAQASRTDGIEEFRHLVENFRIVLEGLETVRKTPRYKKPDSVLGRELEAEAPEISRRVLPDVDDDIVNGTHRAPDQFVLLVRRSLEMHPAQRAGLLVERHIALDEPGSQAFRREFFFAEGTREKPPLVFTAFQFY